MTNTHKFSELDRLTALQKYQLLDSAPEKDFDSLVKLTSLIFDVPIATVTLVDQKRQWFKAKVGLDICETPREISFCDHALRQNKELIVEDTFKDARFSNNPLVLNAPFLRFYAGVPITTPDHFMLGTLCVMDTKPRNVSSKEIEILHLIAAQAMHLIESRLEHIHYVDLTDQVIDANEREISHQEILRKAMDAAANGVWDLDVPTGNAYFGPNWHGMLGFLPGEIPSTYDSWLNLLHPDDIQRVVTELENHLNGSQKDYSIEFRMLCKDGSYKWVLSSGAVIERDKNGKPTRMVGTHTDISSIKEKDEIIWNQANFDSLTGLPNRNLFFDRLVEAIKRAKRDKTKFGILFIDLDGFKAVNDTFGHQSGDALLKQVALNVKSIIRDSDTFARLGGDEFTVILADCKTVDYIKSVAQKIIDLIASPISVGNDMISISASVGGSFYPEAGEKPDEIVKKADDNMYKAKRNGKNQFFI